MIFSNNVFFSLNALTFDLQGTSNTISYRYSSIDRKIIYLMHLLYIYQILAQPLVSSNSQWLCGDLEVLYPKTNLLILSIIDLFIQ